MGLLTDLGPLFHPLSAGTILMLSGLQTCAYIHFASWMPMLFLNRNNTPAEAFEEIRYFHDVVKKVNGTMITIWHNTFLSDVPLYKGWKDVYEIFLNEVVYWDL